MINKETVNRHFTQAAADYERYAQVQKKMAIELILKTRNLKNVQRILEIGCGTGYLTKLVATRFPDAEILATDISAGMLKEAQKNLADYPQIRYALVDGENLTLLGQYDLIISNAVFQWFTNYKNAFSGMYQNLKTGGHLFYTTFGPLTFCELQRAFQRAYEKNKIVGAWQSGPEFYDLEVWEDWLQKVGFRGHCTEKKYIEYFPSVREFLRSVKKVGANNASQGNHTLINRKVMLDMIASYKAMYEERERIQATYQAIYGVARK